MPGQTSSESTPVVLKLGGSLLTLPDLRPRIEDVVRRCGTSPLLMVVGGGAAADLVRDWDRVHQLGDDAAHRLALEAMALNARCVAELLTDAEMVNRPDECDTCWQRHQLAVVNPVTFVPSLETRSGTLLPRTWNVTSDSISAWIGGCLGAERLVLLKSVELPDGGAMSVDGIAVDPAFSTMRERIAQIEWINLRAASKAPRIVLLP